MSDGPQGLAAGRLRIPVLPLEQVREPNLPTGEASSAVGVPLWDSPQRVLQLPAPWRLPYSPQQSSTRRWPSPKTASPSRAGGAAAAAVVPEPPRRQG